MITWIAAILLIGFYALFFLKQLRLRRQGIAVNKLKSQRGPVGRTVGLLMAAATVAAPLAEGTALVLPGEPVLPVGCRLAGLVLAAAGVAVFALALLAMGPSWRAGVSPTEHTALVTGGIYRFSRNPAFLGFDLLYAGLALSAYRPWLLAVSLWAALMLHLQIVLVEEPHLTDVGGEPYRLYKARVRRYLGRR